MLMYAHFINVCTVNIDFKLYSEFKSVDVDSNWIESSTLLAVDYSPSSSVSNARLARSMPIILSVHLFVFTCVMHKANHVILCY